jgi:zinc transport system substrate-binding protein
MSLRPLLAAWLLALLHAPVAAREPLPVLVSILPQQFLVERVGGDRVRTSVLVGSGQNPHTYEPTPRQMAEVSQARAFFRLGIDYEEVWLPRILRVNPGLEVVDQREGLTLRPVDGGHRHADGHWHAPARPDPHVWTSPANAKAMAAQVRDSLGRLDPAGAPAYAQGFERLAADLDALDAEVRAALAGARQRRFLIFHPSWGYFADAYGLEQVPIEQSGKEPGARGLARLIDQARAEGVRAVFVGPQDSPAPAEAVAREIGARVVPLDPLAADYLASLRRMAGALAEALR